jgi:hypothetical protein
MEDILIPIAGMITGVAIIGTLGWTIRFWVAKHYESTTGSLDAGAKAVLERLEDRVAELEDVAGRVQDLEERLDFAERVLVRQREAGQLPGGPA